MRKDEDETENESEFENRSSDKNHNNKTIQPHSKEVVIIKDLVIY